MARAGEKMTIGLDNDSKRLIRNLTKAIDRLARSQKSEQPEPGEARRLVEPAEDEDM